MNGHLHPLTQFMRLSLKYFTERDFQIVEGPEIESEWFNFDALNMIEDHPARDIQDTFWMKDGRVMRTHTTAVDVRYIREKKLKPPFRLIVPGRCFRHEATDMVHEHTFYQIDGIAVDKNLNLGHLIGILDGYMKTLFGQGIKTRVRPGFFPFVEPGMEMDIKLPNGKWQEMLGAGMGHPQVLKNMLSGTKSAEASGEGGGIDPNEYQAIMWGMGIDRYMMQYFKVNDIRLSYSGDLRFLKQF